MSLNAGPIRLVVLQPTPFCNLDCSYCYLPHRSDRRTMRPETLDAVGAKVIASPLAARDVTVVWHGGEPMTLAPAWYDRAFARLAAAAPDRTIAHSFQTNAIGVDDSWVDLWRRWNVRVGVSLDGPERLHDARRHARNGRGSYRLTMRGVERLQAAKLEFHVITVLGAATLADPDGLLDFYLQNDLRNVCFNVEEIEGANRASSLEDPGCQAALRRFLDRFFARVAALDLPFSSRELDRVAMLAMASPEARRHNAQTRPLEIVNVAVDGALSTFSPELMGIDAAAFGDFRFADVHTEGPERLLEHPAFRRLQADIAAGVEHCRGVCAYFDVCGGGAPANKFFEHGHFRGAETLYCRLAVKTVLAAGLDALEAQRVYA